MAALRLISDLGGLFYFAPGSLARAAALGLSPSQWYVLGRGGALGDVDAAVVDSALGCFAPAVMADHWDSGRAVVPPPTVTRAHLECCRDFGRRHLGGAPFLASFVPAAAKVLAAASPVALPLFAGVKTFPLADDLPGAAMQAVAMIGEFGAGVHLLAVTASGRGGRVVCAVHAGMAPGAADGVSKVRARRADSCPGVIPQ